VKALIFFLVSFLSLNVAQAAEQTQKNVILSTTTSTQDSGLLDLLVPLFEKQTGYSVKTVSVGTGQALALAAKGDADVALVHAPTSGFCVKV
jgi:tungstate transport system substrate-binding protein